MSVTEDTELRALLALKRIAVIGCSRTPGKAAHEIPQYLLERGYEIIPVNPFAEEIFGRKAYDSLAEVEEEIDLVQVFRPSEEVAEIVEQVIERKRTRKDVKAIWLQLGIREATAAKKAENEGLQIVQDKCMMVEYRRLNDNI